MTRVALARPFDQLLDPSPGRSPAPSLDQRDAAPAPPAAAGSPAGDPALAEVLAHPALVRLGGGAPYPAPEQAPAWSWAELSGRLCELGPGREPAVLSAAAALVRDAQRRGEPAAWVTVGADLVYPPDLAAGGIDLARLPVVRAADCATAGRAADLLLRSGAYGLVVLDLMAGGPRATLAAPLQSRLSQLARRHDAAVLCLRRPPRDPQVPPEDAPRGGVGDATCGGVGDAARGGRRAAPAWAPGASLGSLVSLRAVASRRPLGPGRFLCCIDVVKDKRRGPGWRWQEVWRGPEGLD